jgi:hypothetical protein
MKKLCLSILLLAYSIIVSAQLKSAHDSINFSHKRDSAIRAFRQDSIKMKFAIRSKSLKSDTKNLILEMEFKNMSDHDIRLLDLFNDMKINFFLTITDEKGKATSPFGGAFADFGPKTILQYINIPKGKSLFRTININNILLQTGNPELPKGVYRIKMSYINNYGKDCIKGRFDANEIKVIIE